MFGHCPHDPPPNPPQEFTPIFQEEAVQLITETLLELISEEENQVDTDTGEPLPATLSYVLTKRQKTVEFYINKFVGDILAYCHRRDFPKPLIFLVVELILKRLQDELSAAESGLGTNAPISEIKMGDTTYKFAVESVDVNACLSTLQFDTIKPTLNLYRKIKAY